MILRWVLILHLCCISVERSSLFKFFIGSFLTIFLSPETVTSINVHVPFSVSWIMKSGLLLGVVLSVCTSWLHDMMVALPSGLWTARIYQSWVQDPPLTDKLIGYLKQVWNKRLSVEHTHKSILLLDRFHPLYRPRRPLGRVKVFRPRH
jgi:hypothetical protein